MTIIDPHVINRAEKTIRSTVIREHMHRANIAGAVMFTCGNAANALRRQGIVDLIEIGPNGTLAAREWWTPAGIAASWPTRFDATPGHLAMPHMTAIAKRLRLAIPEPGRRVTIAAGSGETIVAWHIAYPAVAVTAVYDDRDPATTYDARAPLNDWVAAIAVDIIHHRNEGAAA